MSLKHPFSGVFKVEARTAILEEEKTTKHTFPQLMESAKNAKFQGVSRTRTGCKFRAIHGFPNCRLAYVDFTSGDGNVYRQLYPSRILVFLSRIVIPCVYSVNMRRLPRNRGLKGFPLSLPIHV